MSNLPNLLLSFIFILLAFLTIAIRIFHPYHRLMAFSLLLISAIFFGASYYYNRQYFTHAEGLFKSFFMNYGAFLIVGAGILIFLYVFFTLIPIKSDINKIPIEELSESFEIDAELILYLDNTNKGIVQELNRKSLLEVQGEDLIFQKTEITRLWAQYLSNMIELDILKRKYRGFPHLSVISRYNDHIQAFSLAYASFMSQYSSFLELANLVDDNEQLIVLLNEQNDKYAILAGSYSFLEHKLVDPGILLKLNAGRLYFTLNQKQFETEDRQEIYNLLQSSLQKVQDSVFENYPKIIARNPLKFFEQNAFEYWFPIQKNVALNLSYIHAPQREYLIHTTDILKRQSELQPGDIFLERREWHATNAGIPGYWTHAALYLGSLEELDTYFQGLETLEDNSFSTYISIKYPEAYTTLNNNLEESMRVIEAMRPGVILNSLEETATCDSMAALRKKNITKEEQFKVVTQALSHFGKPYDYTFNFLNDNALVCSELVYKSYLNTPGLELKLDELNGALLYSPNSFAEKFANELDGQDPELELVFFLDGNDKTKEVNLRTPAEFAKSYQRPKWHTLKDYL